MRFWVQQKVAFITCAAIGLACVSVPVYAQFFPDATDSEILHYMMTRERGIVSRQRGGVLRGYEERTFYQRKLVAQRELLKILGKIQGFNEAWAQREALSTIYITQKNTEQKKVREMSERAISEIKDRLFDDLEQAKHRLDDVREAEGVHVVEAVLRLMKNPRLQWSLNGFLVGLSKMLGKAEKAEFFSAGGMPEKISILKAAQVDDQAFRKTFRASEFGLDPASVTFDQAVEELTRAYEDQRRFVRITILGRFIEYNDEKYEERVESWLNELKVEDFWFMRGRNEMSVDFFPELTSERRYNETRRNFERLLKEYEKTAFDVKEVGSSNDVRNQIVLREVPPYLGIFRGFVGGDCSTSLSWPFPYSPFERIFYVYAFGEINPRGYVSITTLEVGKKRMAYVKDLVGARISAQMVHQILYGISQAVAELGVQGVVVPTPGWTRGQNPHREISKAFERYNKKSLSQVGLNFIDKSYRKAIGSFNRRNSYDSPGRHKKGVIYRAKPRVGDELEVTHRFRAPDFNMEYHTPTKLVLPALRAHLKDPSVVDHERNEKVISEEIHALRVVVLNEGRASLGDYYLSLKMTVEAFGIPYDQAFIEENRDLIRIGHLRATDSFEIRGTKKWSEAVTFFLELLKSKDYRTWIPEVVLSNDEIIRRVVREHRGVPYWFSKDEMRRAFFDARLSPLTRSRKVRDYLKQLGESDRAEDRAKLLFLIEQGWSDVPRLAGAKFQEDYEKNCLEELLNAYLAWGRGEKDSLSPEIKKLIKLIKKGERTFGKEGRIPYRSYQLAQSRHDLAKYELALLNFGIDRGKIDHPQLKAFVDIGILGLKGAFDTQNRALSSLVTHISRSLLTDGVLLDLVPKLELVVERVSQRNGGLVKILKHHEAMLKKRKVPEGTIRALVELSNFGVERALKLLRTRPPERLLAHARHPRDIAFLAHEMWMDGNGEKISLSVLETLAAEVGRHLQGTRARFYREYALEVLLNTEKNSQKIEEGLFRFLQGEATKYHRTLALSAYLQRGGKAQGQISPSGLRKLTETGRLPSGMSASIEAGIKKRRKALREKRMKVALRCQGIF